MDCTQFDDLESLFAVIDLFDQDDLQLLSAADSSNLQSQRNALQQHAWDLTSRQHNQNLPDRGGIGHLPPRTNTRTAVFECNACTESFPATILMALNCGHRYCRDCTQQVFTASFSGTAPQCCGERIAFSGARRFLTAELSWRYEALELEQNTTNKVYCSNLPCGKFILPYDVDPEEAFCQSCGTTTCSKCKAAVHSGNCLEDPFLQGVLDLALLHGWQRCPECKRTVELEGDGCNHVTFVSSS
jgi:E3 ubiquitin-protein ligase RNF144